MIENKAHNPLEYRVFKHKNPAIHFFCPLCRSQRAFSVRPYLSKMNYVQIVITSIFLLMISYPIMKWLELWPRIEILAISYFFIIWSAFELFVRFRFRKEIPCPYCGLDASWYRKDIKVARKLVKEFWDAKEKQKNQASAPATAVTTPTQVATNIEEFPYEREEETAAAATEAEAEAEAETETEAEPHEVSGISEILENIETGGQESTQTTP